MFKVMKRECPMFGDGPYVCEFLCDTASDVSTLPTSTSEGTGGKTAYDNQKCASGSIANVAENGSGSKWYMLNNQDVWCPNEIGTGSSYELPVASTDVLGGVMVDGTSIIADEQGVLSAVGGGGLTLLGRYSNKHNTETTIGTLTDIPEGTKLLFMGTKITNTTSTIFYLGVGIVPTFVNGYVFSSSLTLISYGSITGDSYTKTLQIRNYGASGNKVAFYGSNDFPSYLDIYKLEV